MTMKIIRHDWEYEYLLRRKETSPMHQMLYSLLLFVTFVALGCIILSGMYNDLSGSIQLVYLLNTVSLVCLFLIFPLLICHGVAGRVKTEVEKNYEVEKTHIHHTRNIFLKDEGLEFQTSGKPAELVPISNIVTYQKRELEDGVAFRLYYYEANYMDIAGVYTTPSYLEILIKDGKDIEALDLYLKEHDKDWNLYEFNIESDFGGK